MEVFVEIHENVRGEDVFVIQSTSYPTNDNLMELLITLDALRRGLGPANDPGDPLFRLCQAGPEDRPRTPISAKLVANLITEAGANRVLTMDLHAGQIQGFFDIPVDNLPAEPLFSRDIQRTFRRPQHHDRLARCRRRAARASIARRLNATSRSSTSAASAPGTPR